MESSSLVPSSSKKVERNTKDGARATQSKAKAGIGTRGLALDEHSATKSEDCWSVQNEKVVCNQFVFRWSSEGR